MSKSSSQTEKADAGQNSATHPATVRGTYNDSGTAKAVRLVHWVGAPRRTTSNGDHQQGNDCWDGTALVAVYVATTPQPRNGGNVAAGQWLDVPFSHTEERSFSMIARYGTGPGPVQS